MNYKQFCQAMDLLKSYDDRNELFIAAMKPFVEGHGWINIDGGFFVDGVIGLISELVGDKDDWVSWYIYENKWGKGNLKWVSKKGKSFPCKSYKALWRAITSLI